MAEVLAEHGFRKWGDRLDDANWVVCLCGEKVEGADKWQTLLATHQADALTAAGFGEAKEATAPEVRYVDLTSGENVLDEVVAFNASGGQSVHVNLHTKRAKITGRAEVEDEEWLNEPRATPPSCTTTVGCIKVDKHKSKCAVLG
jgi:hypothetical protein